MSSLAIQTISKTFGRTAVLRGVDITIPDGCFFTLLGPSGCGKTTLLRILAGFVEPCAGRVLFDGEDVTRVPAHNLTFVRQGEPRVRLLEQVSGVIAEAGPRAPLEYAMQALVEDGLRIDAVSTDGLPWFEIDTPDDLAVADALFQPVAEPA